MLNCPLVKYKCRAGANSAAAYRPMNFLLVLLGLSHATTEEHRKAKKAIGKLSLNPDLGTYAIGAAVEMRFIPHNGKRLASKDSYVLDMKCVIDSTGKAEHFVLRELRPEGLHLPSTTVRLSDDPRCIGQQCFLRILRPERAPQEDGNSVVYTLIGASRKFRMLEEPRRVQFANTLYLNTRKRQMEFGIPTSIQGRTWIAALVSLQHQPVTVEVLDECFVHRDDSVFEMLFVWTLNDAIVQPGFEYAIIFVEDPNKFENGLHKYIRIAAEDPEYQTFPFDGGFVTNLVKIPRTLNHQNTTSLQASEQMASDVASEREGNVAEEPVKSKGKRKKSAKSRRQDGYSRGEKKSKRRKHQRQSTRSTESLLDELAPIATGTDVATVPHDENDNLQSVLPARGGIQKTSPERSLSHANRPAFVAKTALSILVLVVVCVVI